MGIKHMYGEEQISEAATNSFTNQIYDVHWWYFFLPRLTEPCGRNTHHDEQSSIYSGIRKFISSESVQQLQCYKSWLFHLNFMALKMWHLEKIRTSILGEGLGSV